MDSGPHEFTVEGPGGERLDHFLAERLHVSRGRVRAALDARLVSIDGRIARKGDRLSVGAVVRARIPGEPSAPDPEPDLPLAVRFEDPWILAVEKPAGWPCHPLRTGERGTLANAILARFPECAAASETPREGGLCHRLDRETSGLVLVARRPEAYRAIRSQLGAHTVGKHYLALACGDAPDAGHCELSLGQRRNGPPRAVTRPGELRGIVPARSAYRTIARAQGLSLLEVTIETGARYQIRAHLAALGLPLAGDAIYCGGEALQGLGRHLLHAARVTFDHPADGHRVTVESPLPGDAMLALRTAGFDLEPG